MFWPPVQGGICRGEPGNFPLTGSNLPIFFIQNCCWITASFTYINDERLVSKMEGKTNFSRRLQAVRNQDC